MQEAKFTPLVVSHDEMQRIERIFTYHAPKGSQPERYNILRGKAKGLALDFLKFCPESGERAFAIHYLELAIMSANAAIARNE